MAENVFRKTEDQWKKQIQFNEEMKGFQGNFNIRFDEFRAQLASLGRIFMESQKPKFQEAFEAEFSSVQQLGSKTDEFDLSHQLKNSNRYDSLKIPKINFPIFYGVQPREWIRNCEQYFIIHAISDDIKLRLVELHLRGEAELWLIRWKLSNPSLSMSWEFLKDEICNNFFKEEPMEAIVDPLNQSKSNPDHETLEVNEMLYSQEIISCESVIKHSIVEGKLSFVYEQIILCSGCESTISGSPKARFEEVTSGLKVVSKNVMEDDAYKVFDELTKPMPIDVTGVNRAFGEYKDVILLIDDVLMFYFDPGGRYLPQVGCDLFELTGEQGARWFTTNVVDTCVTVDEYYSDTSVSPSSRVVPIFELAVSIQNGIIVKVYDVPNRELRRDFAEWNREEFLILMIEGTMMIVKTSSDFRGKEASTPKFLNNQDYMWISSFVYFKVFNTSKERGSQLGAYIRVRRVVHNDISMHTWTIGLESYQAYFLWVINTLIKTISAIQLFTQGKKVLFFKAVILTKIGEAYTRVVVAGLKPIELWLKTEDLNGYLLDENFTQPSQLLSKWTVWHKASLIAQSLSKDCFSVWYVLHNSATTSCIEIELVWHVVALLDSQVNGILIILTLIKYAEVMHKENEEPCDILVKQIGLIVIFQAGLMREIETYFYKVLVRRSPIVAFEDDAIDKAIAWIVFRCFLTMGGICRATSHLHIHIRSATKLLGKLIIWCQDVNVSSNLEAAGCYSWVDLQNDLTNDDVGYLAAVIMISVLSNLKRFVWDPGRYLNGICMRCNDSLQYLCWCDWFEGHVCDIVDILTQATWRPQCCQRLEFGVVGAARVDRQVFFITYYHLFWFLFSYTLQSTDTWKCTSAFSRLEGVFAVIITGVQIMEMISCSTGKPQLLPKPTVRNSSWQHSITDHFHNDVDVVGVLIGAMTSSYESDKQEEEVYDSVLGNVSPIVTILTSAEDIGTGMRLPVDAIMTSINMGDAKMESFVWDPGLYVSRIFSILEDKDDLKGKEFVRIHLLRIYYVLFKFYLFLPKK